MPPPPQEYHNPGTLDANANGCHVPNSHSGYSFESGFHSSQSGYAIETSQMPNSQSGYGLDSGVPSSSQSDGMTHSSSMSQSSSYSETLPHGQSYHDRTSTMGSPYLEKLPQMRSYSQTLPHSDTLYSLPLNGAQEGFDLPESEPCDLLEEEVEPVTNGNRTSSGSSKGNLLSLAKPSFQIKFFFLHAASNLHEISLSLSLLL